MKNKKNRERIQKKIRRKNQNTRTDRGQRFVKKKGRRKHEEMKGKKRRQKNGR